MKKTRSTQTQCEAMREAIRANAGLKSGREIADELGVPLQVVHNHAHDMGVSLKVHRRPQSQTLVYIREHAGIKPAAQIAEELGVSEGHVRCMASQNGVALRITGQLSPRQASVSEDDLEAASKLLRAHGWTVLRPDPFKRPAPDVGA